MLSKKNKSHHIKGSNDDFKGITTPWSTLISQYITHYLPLTLQLQKLIKEFYFYVIYTKSSKLVDLPGKVALSV